VSTLPYTFEKEKQISARLFGDFRRVEGRYRRHVDSISRQMAGTEQEETHVDANVVVCDNKIDGRRCSMARAAHASQHKHLALIQGVLLIYL
jgi:hypothetical protein